MRVLSNFVTSLRFLLGTTALFGLLGSLFTHRDILTKVSFTTFAVLTIILWSRYGAPKASHRLSNPAKIILELFILSFASLSFFWLYGSLVGLVFSLVSLVDLLLLYILRLD
ncbi:DUF2568 domain-containing protein [Streptococcus sobrinus]|uniref:DUF2568 domain-containing protein n=1 Tax=Streptococcus sobrinus TaxID=1310 RepID=UPI000380668A|nr:DUF2568 domain-containing protein [Streptococcus sobrinus]